MKKNHRRTVGQPLTCPHCGAGFLAYRPEKQYCSRSCASAATAHTRIRRGAANNRYNGGLSAWQGRTIVVFRDGGHMLYSRAVMAGHVGRLLRPDEIVHHINGDPTDDRIENLAIVTRAEHITLHRAELMTAQRKAAA